MKNSSKLALTNGESFSTEVIDVGPPIAKEWLELNHERNRTVSWPRVKTISRDMKAGAWKLTHQAICFGGDGKLIDGQHRLYAVVDADVTVPMLVVRSSLSFDDPIDRGAGRSIAFLMGTTSNVAAGLNTLRMLEYGLKGRTQTGTTVAETKSVLARHREPIEALNLLHTRLRGGVSAALVWAWPVDPRTIEQFSREIILGEMLKRGDPAYSLREWLSRNKKEGRWEVCMAALNCARARLVSESLDKIFTGTNGYVALCTRRRAMKILHTPSVEEVGSSVMKQKKKDVDDMGKKTVVDLREDVSFGDEDGSDAT